MVFEKVAKIIAERLECELEDIKPETKFDTLGADSLDVMEILMDLEEEFNIDEIEIGEGKIDTVSDLAALIESKLG